ncbi:MAG TPA: AraC family transcriptional regulator [Polyangiaceae bacterium]|nr:AraC family transcriptional regulator [Polyangiaceae bacterium]
MPGHSKLAPELAAASVRHGVLGPVAGRVFEKLGVGASLWYLGSWLDIHERIGTVAFEIEHGGELERWSYNDRCLLKARQTRTSVVGHHAGSSDLYVPIRMEPDVEAVIVVGPFATTQPTSSAILERWRLLTGRKGDLADPEFASYLSATLSTLVLEEAMVVSLKRLVECFAALMACSGSAGALYLEVESLQGELMKARRADRMWEAARAMIDERTSRLWAAACRNGHLEDLGVDQFPKHALVGLYVNREQKPDRLTEVLACDAFRRACVEIAGEFGNVVAGQVGDNGVSFLAAKRESVQRSRAALQGLAERAAALARKRFGLALHMGLSTLPVPLSQQYQSALAAADSALSRGVALVHAGASARPLPPLSPYRQGLARLAEENPEALPARFDRYLELVADRYASRVEPARAQLELGFEQIGEALLRSGALEAKSMTLLRTKLERSAGTVGSLHELGVVYRAALRGLLDAGRGKPAPSRHERGISRAEVYMREHHGEPLTRAKVARVAGFAETYFSELFHRKQGVTFGRYLMRLRVERAKKLLADTPLHLQRIAELAGFRTRQYLGRVFKSETGETPALYRKRSLRGHPPYKYVP